MKLENEGSFKVMFSRDNHTGRFLKEHPEPVPLFDVGFDVGFDDARRFSCVFLTTSANDATRLNRQLSTAGIRAYHAGDTREAAVLLSLTNAKILLIDIDRTFDQWLETLQKLDESHPNVPKVVLTARGPDICSLILAHFALDVIPKPAHLGDLLGSLECAHALEMEISDPERVREREARVMSAIRSGGQPPRVFTLPSIRMRLSAMMKKVTYVWWKLSRHRTRKQASHA
jgi:ActR/RegA family two-component response regulator